MGISGAPTVGNLSIQKPFASKLSSGLNLGNENRGLVNTTSVLISNSYYFPVSGESFVRFGISIGGGWNKVDINSLSFGSTDDNVIGDLLSSNFQLLGNAGIAFHSKTFQIGVALPNIFQPSYITKDAFTISKVKPFESIILQSSYRFYFGSDKYAFEPNLLYRLNSSIPSQLEAAGLVHIHNIAWVGGSYKQNFGISAMLGFKFGKLMGLGYSYSIKNTGINQMSRPSHEIQLAMLFGVHNKKIPILSFVNSEKDKMLKTTYQKQDYFAKNNPKNNKQAPAGRPRINLGSYTVDEGETPQPTKKLSKSEAAKAEAARVATAKKEAARVAAEKLTASKAEAARVASEKAEAAKAAAAAKVEATKVEAAKLEAAKVETAKIEAAKIEAAKIEAAKAASTKVGAPKQPTDKTEAAKLEAAKVEAAKVEAAKVEAAKVAAAKVAAAKIEAAKIEAAKVETAKVEAAKVEAAKVEATKVETAKVEAAKVEAAKVEAAKVEAAKVEAAKVEAAKVEAAKKVTATKEVTMPDMSRPEKFASKVDSIQHHEELEKISRLTEHAEDPTEEHSETGHPHAERHEFAQRGNHVSEMDLGDYVIVGVFRSEVNAKHMASELKKLGFSDVDYGFSSHKSVWYIHFSPTDDIEEAKTQRNKYRKMKMFRDAWLLTIHQ